LSIVRARHYALTHLRLKIEEFSFEANSSVNPAVIHQLATCAWVKAGHPLCLIGDSGTGKSHCPRSFECPHSC
jgi:DNA replication protein DnaC